MSRRFTAIALLATLVLVAPALVGPAGAEIIRLKNGRMLQGEIDSARTTDEAITVTLYRDGAVLRVLWAHVLGRDARRLREALGLDVLEGETLMMPGHELILSSGETKKGLVVDPPEGGDGATNWYLKTAEGGGAPQAWPKRLVQAVNPIELPVLEVYTQDEAVERKVTEIAGDREPTELGWQEALEIADYAYRLGAYAHSKTWYERARGNEECSEKTFIDNKLKNLDILVQAAEASDLFAEIKRLQFKDRFEQALEKVKEFRDQYGSLTQLIALYKLDIVEKRLQVALKEQRISIIGQDWLRNMDRLISSKVADDELTLKDAMTYAQKDLTDEIVKALAEKLGIEPEYVLELWGERESKARTATYGYGTFAAPEEAAKAKAGTKKEGMSREEIRRRLLEAARKKRSQSNSKEKPPKTPDEWWKHANRQSRRNWLTAFYVEHGNANFEILRVYWDRCNSCTGNGYIVHNVAMGSDDGNGQEKVRCETCNGHGKIRLVRYK